jgi:hypothetical protein
MVLAKARREFATKGPGSGRRPGIRSRGARIQSEGLPDISRG